MLCAYMRLLLQQLGKRLATIKADHSEIVCCCCFCCCLQFRQKTFHADGPEQMTVDAVESFFWKAIRAPLGGTTFEPLLSLFTPAYKSGTKIHIPYESLLKQSYQNWEWVIYDDSPPEHTETWRELSALRDKDVRVRVYKSDRNDAFIGSVKVCQFRFNSNCKT